MLYPPKPDMSQFLTVSQWSSCSPTFVLPEALGPDGLRPKMNMAKVLTMHNWVLSPCNSMQYNGDFTDET